MDQYYFNKYNKYKHKYINLYNYIQNGGGICEICKKDKKLVNCTIKKCKIKICNECFKCYPHSSTGHKIDTSLSVCKSCGKCIPTGEESEMCRECKVEPDPKFDSSTVNFKDPRLFLNLGNITKFTDYIIRCLYDSECILDKFKSNEQILLLIATKLTVLQTIYKNLLELVIRLGHIALLRLNINSLEDSLEDSLEESLSAEIFKHFIQEIAEKHRLEYEMTLGTIINLQKEQQIIEDEWRSLLAKNKELSDVSTEHNKQCKTKGSPQHIEINKRYKDIETKFVEENKEIAKAKTDKYIKELEKIKQTIEEKDEKKKEKSRKDRLAKEERTKELAATVASKRAQETAEKEAAEKAEAEARATAYAETLRQARLRKKQRKAEESLAAKSHGATPDAHEKALGGGKIPSAAAKPKALGAAEDSGYEQSSNSKWSIIHNMDIADIMSVFLSDVPIRGEVEQKITVELAKYDRLLSVNCSGNDSRYVSITIPPAGGGGGAAAGGGGAAAGGGGAAPVRGNEIGHFSVHEGARDTTPEKRYHYKFIVVDKDGQFYTITYKLLFINSTNEFKFIRVYSNDNSNTYTVSDGNPNLEIMACIERVLTDSLLNPNNLYGEIISLTQTIKKNTDRLATLTTEPEKVALQKQIDDDTEKLIMYKIYMKLDI